MKHRHGRQFCVIIVIYVTLAKKVNKFDAIIYGHHCLTFVFLGLSPEKFLRPAFCGAKQRRFCRFRAQIILAEHKLNLRARHHDY